MALSLLLEDFIISHFLVPECDAVPYFEEYMPVYHLYRLFYCQLPKLPLGESRWGSPSVWVCVRVLLIGKHTSDLSEKAG